MVPASNHALPLTHPKIKFMQGIGQTADTSVSVVPASIHHSNHALSLTHPKNMFMPSIGQTGARFHLSFHPRPSPNPP